MNYTVALGNVGMSSQLRLLYYIVALRRLGIGEHCNALGGALSEGRGYERSKVTTVFLRGFYKSRIHLRLMFSHIVNI
jgi:hypothetical protein